MTPRWSALGLSGCGAPNAGGAPARRSARSWRIWPEVPDSNLNPMRTSRAIIAAFPHVRRSTMDILNLQVRRNGAAELDKQEPVCQIGRAPNARIVDNLLCRIFVFGD